MKILIRGSDKPAPIKPSRTYRCTCKHCNSDLEYETKDLVQGDRLGHWLVWCPVCRGAVYQNFIQRWWNRFNPSYAIGPGKPG